MDWLEEELKRALVREDPPPGWFAPAPARRPWRKWLAVAATVMVAASSAAGYRHHQGTVAKEKLKLAVGIAAVRVHHIQDAVRQVTQ